MAAATLEQSPASFLRGAALEKAKRDAGIALTPDLEAILQLEESPPQEDAPKPLHNAPPTFLLTPISPEQKHQIRWQCALDQAKKNLPVLLRADHEKGLTLEEAQRIEAERILQQEQDRPLEARPQHPTPDHDDYDDEPY